MARWSARPRQQHGPLLRRLRGIGVRLLGTMIVIALLLWGLDNLGRAGAQSLLAQDIDSAIGGTATPVVTIKGRPFLPQVISGAYSEVDVDAVGISTGPLRVDRIQAQLIDVRIPFHDVLVRDLRTVGIARSTEQVTIRYADLDRYLQVTGRPLTVTPVGGDRLQLTGTLSVLRQQIQVTAVVALTIENGALQMSPISVTTNPQSLQQAVELLLTQRLTFTVPMDGLPFGQQLVSVTPGPETIVITARGNGLVLQP